MELAPIVLFAYCRPLHTRKTVNALLNNLLASDSDLIIYSDAAQNQDMQGIVDELRAYLATITGFRSVSVRHRSHNFGLSRSIIGGVSEVLRLYDRVIVVEDDLVTSPYFLTYMNEALERYALDDRVASIHGYVYPCVKALPEAFFLRGADCWGWSTWRRAWAHFNPDGQYLLGELRRRKLLNEFDFNGTYPFSKMLLDQIKGINDSWAVRWHASAFLASKLTLYPGRSLVHNIGNDTSGTHCSETTKYDTVFSESPIDLNNIVVEPSNEGRLAFEDFFRASEAGRYRLVSKVLFGRAIKSVKAIAKDWLPPTMLRWARRIVHGVKSSEAIRFEGEIATWEEASARCTGYDAQLILEKVLAATLMVKRGEAVYERDSILFDEIEYSWPMLVGLMWAAAQNGGKLNVLDFGGSLGSSYFQHRRILQSLIEVHWNVVEQAHYVDAGRASIQDEHLHFYRTIEECLSENQPNVILLSSVMQYLSEPFAVLLELMNVGASVIVLDRTIVNNSGHDRIYAQHVPSSIYKASYPCRSISESGLISHLNKGYAEFESFPSLCFPALNAIDSEFKGYIFYRKNIE